MAEENIIEDSKVDGFALLELLKLYCMTYPQKTSPVASIQYQAANMPSMCPTVSCTKFSQQVLKESRMARHFYKRFLQ